MKIAGVLLAAGSSRRMGDKNKLLLKYKKYTIFEETLTNMKHSKLNNIIVVTGFEHKKIENMTSSHLNEKIGVVYNKNYDLGRYESIKCAIKNIPPETDGLLFMVADKPMVSSELINKSLETFVNRKPDICYVETPNGRGHPILFSAKLKIELLNLIGDRATDQLIEKYQNSTIAINDDNPQFDINTSDDYDRFLNSSNAL